MNKAAAELANGPGPGDDEDAVDYWLGRIRRLRNTRVGVPPDEDVRRGITARKAYGGSGTASSFAVLCSLMEADHREESPARERLTVEHVMPQKLTDEWRHALGPEAEEIHQRHCHRLANLTLSGDVTNSTLGTATFEKKCEVYRKSTIGLSSSLAEETEWSEEALLRRADNLGHRALELWPWSDQASPEALPSAESTTSEGLRWRIEDGPWHAEDYAAQMVCNVAGALLDLDRRNAKKLTGKALVSNLHPTSRYPAGSKAGSLTMRAVPGHPDYVLNPYERDYPASAARCREMGKRCGVKVEVKGFAKVSRRQIFFRFLSERGAGFPGQKDSWRGSNQWTSPLNQHGDRIGMFVGEDELWLWIRGYRKASVERTNRMRRYSRLIGSRMADQEIVGSPAKKAARGKSVRIRRQWDLDDEDDWLDAAEWLQEQRQRMEFILADPVAPKETR